MTGTGFPCTLTAGETKAGILANFASRFSFADVSGQISCQLPWSARRDLALERDATVLVFMPFLKPRFVVGVGARPLASLVWLRLLLCSGLTSGAACCHRGRQLRWSSCGGWRRLRPGPEHLRHRSCLAPSLPRPPPSLPDKLVMLASGMLHRIGAAGCPCNPCSA
jgi:hypothetical protein